MSPPIQKLLSLKLGQLLLVETNKELLVGTLKHIDAKYLRIELDNVRDIKRNFTYTSSQMLAYSEMKSIKVVEEDQLTNNRNDSAVTDSDDLLIKLNSTSKAATTASNSFTSSTTVPESHNDHQHHQPQSNSSSKEECDSFNIQLTSMDFQMLQTQLDTMIYITQTDQKYHKALRDIRTQSVIGLIVDPIYTGRNRKTSLIAMATSHNIYIFDMISLGKIFKEFRIILESERPRKAVHYSHKIVDLLKYRHSVELAGIFDTFVAYCVVTGEKSSTSLDETVQKIFNISNLYFETEDDNNTLQPYQRPVTQEQRMIIAKKVAFQLKLYDHLLHEQMLKNFYQQCQKFSQTFANNDDDFQVAQQYQSNSRAGYQHIQPNGNWKDKLEAGLGFF